MEVIGVVLLVDDEPDILVSVGRLLEESLPGVRVLAAASGQTALKVLEQNHVDMVVADFRMDEMDGIEFLCLARGAYPEARRAILTAHGNDDVRRRAQAEAGVEAFFSKAADPMQFVARVGKMLGVKPAP